MSVPVQNVCKSKLHVCMGCCLKANNRRLSKILNVATLKSKISSWKALGFLLLRVAALLACGFAVTGQESCHLRGSRKRREWEYM